MRCSESISVNSVLFIKWSFMVTGLTRWFLCVLSVKLVSRITLSDHILAWVMNLWSTCTPHSSHQPALTDPHERLSSASARLALLLSLPCPQTAGSNAPLHKRAANKEEPLSHSSPFTRQPGVVSLGLCRHHSLVRMADPFLSFLTHRQRVTQDKHGCQASPLS